MDRTKRDLEALVATQKEQLTRYEKRLKDVVTAYKGLLKEKEALDTSLAAITTNSSSSSKSNTETMSSSGDTTLVTTEKSLKVVAGSSDSIVSDSESADDRNQLQTQIITLMNSLATLSAEKSRMEASFQADKKQLRIQMAQKEQTVTELQGKIKDIEERSKIAVDEVKAKWIIERQEREKETNNQMLMIRELQKLYADERHLKENIEMQLNNFKTQFASDEAENSRLKDLQAQLKEARHQLKHYQSKKSSGDSDTISNPAILKQVQQEMQQLKEQHAIAIKVEQKRVHIAEERSKKLAAIHEDRVANLEARLAELSATVGTYDRFRHQDQKSIQELKQKLQDIDINRNGLEQEDKMKIPEIVHNNDVYRKLSKSDYDISRIVDEVMNLKKILISENARSANPIDVSKVFSINTDHIRCQEDLNRAQQQFDAAKVEIVKSKEKIEVQKTHISTLQEKVIVLNRNIDEQELELKQQHEKKYQAVKDERSKWKDILAELENEYRSKVYEMEQQLQKQRQRSLQLLDEKEQEIKTLQTSFEVFHSATIPTVATVAVAEQYNNVSSDGESVEGGNNGNVAGSNKVAVKSKKLSVGGHMLHYANEIARKDIEISGLRKMKYAAETSLRKSIHDKVTVQEELCDKIAELEEQVDRLERCKTREGANLEYLKNVIISFIMTKDADDKQHMLNAISAVLEFTPSEKKLAMAHTTFPKK